MVISVAVDCKYDSRQGKAKAFSKEFSSDENLKQQWLIKIKRRNIQSMQHVRMYHTHIVNSSVCAPTFTSSDWSTYGVTCLGNLCN